MTGIRTNAGHVADRMERAALLVPAIIAATGAGMAEAAGRVLVDAIRAETPVISGELRDSTESETRMEGPIAHIEIRQTAQSPDGVYYGPIVIEGRRAMGLAAGDHFGHPLRTPWGPRWSVAEAAPNPYNRRALDGARAEEIRATLTGGARAMTRRIWESMQ